MARISLLHLSSPSRTKLMVVRGGGWWTHVSVCSLVIIITIVLQLHAGHQTRAPSAAATSRVQGQIMCQVPNISAFTEQGLLSRAQPFVSL